MMLLHETQQKNCRFVSLHAEQTKSVSINAEFLSERSGSWSRKSVYAEAASCL